MAIKNEMVDAICKELKIQKDFLKGESIQSVYFGGGTPSVLDQKQLDSIVMTAKDYFPIAADAEISIEANPDDITAEKLAELSAVGFNRLSVGIQSFDKDILQWMNRAHNSEEAYQCLESIKNSAFDNYSLDLIYGIPIASHEIWQKDLETLVSFEPPHISSYCLTIEPDTVFGRWKSKGKLTESTEDYSSDQFIFLSNYLQQQGYEHYEVSNFGKPGFHSQHNSSYWQQIPYLGVGPAAHSFDGTHRQFNISNNHKYLKALNEDKIPAEMDLLSKEDRINEYLMTSLRTSKGCSLHYLKDQLQYDLQQEAYTRLLTWQETGLCVIENNTLTLTQKGRLLADQLASDLFIVT